MGVLTCPVFNFKFKFIQPTSENPTRYQATSVQLKIWALVDYCYSTTKSGERQPQRSLL